MAKPVQLITQHLSRSKAAFLKGQTLRPMVSVAEALKLMITHTLHSTETQKVASLLRENLQNISKIKAVKAIRQDPFIYQKGEEKKILAALIPIIKTIHAEKKRESRNAKRERLLKIDQAIIHGKNALEGGKLDEARKYFREAVNLNVDEHAMHLIIADALQAGGAYKESFEYLRQALMLNNNDRKACEMVVEATVKTGNLERGAILLRKLSDKKGSSAHLCLGQAQIAVKQKKWADVLKHAKAAVAHDEELMDAVKLVRKAEAKAAKA